MLNLPKYILREMLAHKMRSLLAILGVAIGTLTVTLLLALGAGFHDAAMKTLMTTVDGSFYVWPGTTSQAYQGYNRGQPVYITIDDVIAMPKIFSSNFTMAHAAS